VISILVPYVAYLAGNEVHASGVLAVIACGMYMSRKSTEILSAEVRLQTTAVWEALTFVLNGMVFVLIGLQLPYVVGQIGGVSKWALMGYGALFSVVMIGVRLVWVYGETYGAYAVRRWVSKSEVKRPDGRSVFVIGWTGMRGVLSLAAAFTLPYALPGGQPFTQRSMIIFLTFYLIVVTLVVQGLTLPWLIRVLGLGEPGKENVEEQEARRMLLREAMVHLDRARAKDEGDAGAIFDEALVLYQQRLDAVPVHRQERVGGQTNYLRRREVLLGALQVERVTLIRLRDEGRIDDEVLRTLQRELDLTESRTHTAASALH
jgi:NhaP-type Na+/H+ or K+/H+ antiporter